METIFISNHRKATGGSVQLIKIDACDPRLRLPGAVFDLLQYAAEGCYLPCRLGLVTGRAGTLRVDGLSAGRYKLVERRPPPGYRMGSKTEFSFELQEGKGAVSRIITVTNQRAVSPAPCCCCQCSCERAEEKPCKAQKPCTDGSAKLPDISRHLEGKSYEEIRKYLEAYN